jgi:hypothetical protein
MDRTLSQLITSSVIEILVLLKFCTQIKIIKIMVLLEVTNKRSRHIIWLATTWCLWCHRNNIVFHGDYVKASSLVEQIKYIAWFWLIGREKLNVNVAFSD